MNLNDYIGEATAYDKKLMLERKDPTSWLKSVSAFANTQGGRLLFGVANDGVLVGLVDAGGMPSGHCVQELDARQVTSKRRNPVIADLFQRLDLMERRGSGFGKILRAYDLESHKRGRDFKVLFSSIHMGFTLVLPNLNYGQTIDGLVGEEPMDGSGKADVMGESLVRAVRDVDWDVDKNVVRILDVVKGDPHVTQQEIATRLNLSLRGVEDMIKRAREKGLIRRVGGKRFGHWEVVK